MISHDMAYQVYRPFASVFDQEPFAANFFAAIPARVFDEDRPVKIKTIL
jgi:hypothetical protein